MFIIHIWRNCYEKMEWMYFLSDLKQFVSLGVNQFYFLFYWFLINLFFRHIPECDYANYE